MRVMEAEQAYNAAEEAEAILFAENIQTFQAPDGRPLAITMSEMEGFTESERRFHKLLGSVAMQGSVERPQDSGEKMTILEAIRAAREGSTQAESMIDINIATAVTEACFKYDHITKVAMRLNDSGDLMQFGQTMQEMHFNSIVYRQNRHAKLQDVTKIEALNGHCIEDAARAGLLKDYYFIADSLVPQDVPEKDLKDEGYFLNTLTFVTQATTAEDGVVTTESVFSKGTAAHESARFHKRIDKRFDLEAVSRVRQRLGLSPVTTTEEALRGIFVHKSMLPNGVIDYKRMIDEEAHSVAGVSLKTDDYYEQLAPRSKEREESLERTKQLVKEALLEQARTLKTPMEAVQCIGDLVHEFTVISAVDNHHIDAYIFGKQAAQQIEETRYRMSIGDVVGAQLALREAVRVAVISFCGGGSAGRGANKGGSSKNKKSEKSSDENTEDEQDAMEQNEDWTWKRGICRVDSCPTRPGKTQVGPCAVCKRCQKMFDKGIDPTKFTSFKSETVNDTPSWKDAIYTKNTVVLSVASEKPLSKESSLKNTDSGNRKILVDQSPRSPYGIEASTDSGDVTIDQR